MKTIGQLCFRRAGFAALGVGLCFAASAAPGTTDAKQARMLDAYGRLPLSFEVNQGQTDPSVRFLARGRGYGLYLRTTDAVLSLTRTIGGEPKSIALRTIVSGANPDASVSAEDLQAGRSNHFIGSDPSQWVTGVRHYGRVRYREIYDGVDLVYYGNQQQLEYDFIVSPGADFRQIRMRFEGAKNLRLNAAGDLVITTELGELTHKRPFIYQEVDGKRRTIEGRYVLRSGEAGLAIARYDRKKPLIIDPVLIYSTFFGGSSGDQGSGIAVDTAGSAYITGATASNDFPVSVASGYRGGTSDAFITKLNPAGNAIAYSTYLGSTGNDQAWSIAVSSDGSANIAGQTDSINFPRQNANQTTIGGKIDGFAARLSPEGALAWSTFIGGFENDFAKGIALDANNNVYVVGQTGSTNFQAVGGLQSFFGGGTSDGWVFKFDPNGTRVYSTYLGGLRVDGANAVAVDADGNAYVAGSTNSLNFPTRSPIQGHQIGLGTTSDAFVAIINPGGTDFIFSTYLGGTASDEALSIAIDSDRRMIVAGDTESANFPVSNAAQGGYGGNRDGFLTKINAGGAGMAFSTFVGGSQFDSAKDVYVENNGNITVVGNTVSTNFPVSNFFQGVNNGSTDAFVARYNGNGARLSSTYLGGVGEDTATAVAVDTNGSTYVTGTTLSTNFPVLNPLQLSLLGGQDAFVSKISNCLVTLSPGSANAPNTSGLGVITISGPADCPWNAVANDAWLGIVNPTSGTGNATLTYSFLSNPAGQRTGTLNIGGVTFTVTQAPAFNPGCFFPLNPESVIAPATGTTGTFRLDTTTPACTWTARSNARWAQVFPLNGTGTTTLAFTVFPNFSTLLRNTTFEVGDKLFTIVQAAASGTADQRFVSLIYFNFFGRYPSQAEIDFQVASGLPGGRPNLVMNFFNSPEFDIGGRFIAGLYTGLLGRDPEFGGWLFQRNALALGIVNQDQLIANFLGSTEFIAKYGTLDNPAFVRLMYTNILGRQATQAEVDFQVAALNSGATRVSLAKSFLNSQEFRVATLARLDAFLLYATLLQRDPTTPELDFRANQISLGVPLVTLVQEFLNSSEFQAQLQ